MSVLFFMLNLAGPNQDSTYAFPSRRFQEGVIATSPNLTLLGSDDHVRAIVLQTGGRIVVAAATNVGAESDFVLLRYGSDGHPDRTFGSTGKVLVDFAVDTLLASSGDDKVIVVGQQQSSSTSVNQSAVMIARYNADGSLDTTFGNSGFVKTTVPLEQASEVRTTIIF